MSMKRAVLERFSILLVTFSFVTSMVLGIAPKGQTLARDCDANAVMYCGAGSTEELKSKYRANQSGNTQAIFAHFGIGSEAALNGMVVGSVTANNNVYVGGRHVATNAVTAGRQNMPGSTPILGGAAYQRPPSVSFRSGSLPAFVKLDGNGRFMYAVIMSCGNPVRAVPTAPTPPPPPPQPKPEPKPQPVPNFTITKQVREFGSGGEWRQSVRTQPDGKVRFRIVVRNTGQTTFNRVMVRDVLPERLSFVHNTLQVNGSPRQVGGSPANAFNVGSLKPNQQVVVTFVAQAAGENRFTPGECRDVTNRAFAKPDGLPEKRDDANVRVCREKQVPKFEIDKKVKLPGTEEWRDTVRTEAGSTVRYRIVVKNTGNTNLTRMTFRDNLPGRQTLVPGSVAVDGNARPGISDLSAGFNLGTLKPGERRVVTFRAKVADANRFTPGECRDMTNRAFAKPNELPERKDDANVRVCLPKEKPDFTIDKRVKLPGTDGWHESVTANPGDTVRYQVVVKNTGNTDLKRIMVRDLLPGRQTFVAGSLAVNGEPRTNVTDLSQAFNIGTLKPGEQSVITFRAKVAEKDKFTPGECKDMTNRAFAKPDGLDEKRDNANVRVCLKKEPPAKPDFSIDKKVKVTGDWKDADEAKPGQTAHYQVVVRNTGQTDLTELMFRDVLPPNVSLVAGSVTVNGQARDVTDLSQPFNIGPINKGQSVTIRFSVKVDAEDSFEAGKCKMLRNHAFAKPKDMAEKQAHADLKVCRPKLPPTPPEKPAFTVDKTTRKSGDSDWVQSVNANADSEVEFRVRVTNTGSTDFAKVVVRDVLPNGLTLVSGSVHVDGQVQAHVNDVAAGIDVGELKKGQTKSVTFKAKVAAVSHFEQGKCVVLRNHSYAKPDNMKEQKDSADVVVCRDAKPPVTPEQPVQPGVVEAVTTEREEIVESDTTYGPSVLPSTGTGAIAAGAFSVTTILGAVLHRLKEFWLNLLNK
jgi:uncharacterized repeat protein (TIGR01451 family)